jgi:hypothetical protein
LAAPDIYCGPVLWNQQRLTNQRGADWIAMETTAVS